MVVSRTTRSNARVVDRLVAVREEAVGDVLVDTPVAAGREEPELVLLDRTALRDVDVPHLAQRVGRREALAFASAVLSDWRLLLPAEKKVVPLNWLPPSLGIMLARTPPAEVSALMALVW